MIEIPSFRPETRYGMPPADHLLFNREYIIGYSYLMRQARWAMEVIDPHNARVEVQRNDAFRADLRIPEQFRADLEDYRGSGFDRGHLIASADRRAERVENSETFLLTNMAPQKPRFNRGIWKRLEEAVRALAAQDDILEVYTICGPLFNFQEKLTKIGADIVVPHGFFKSVLSEDRRGKLKLRTFAISNKDAGDKQLRDCMKRAVDVERWSGLALWDRLRGAAADRLRAGKGRMWAMS